MPAITPLPTGPITLPYFVDKLLSDGLSPATGTYVALGLVVLGCALLARCYFRSEKERGQLLLRAEAAEREVAELRADQQQSLALLGEAATAPAPTSAPALETPAPAPVLNPAETFVADLLAGKVGPTGQVI